MSDENLILQRVETWTVVALKEYVMKRGLPVTGSKTVLAASEILVTHAVINALFAKKCKIWLQTLNSNSKQTFVYSLWPLCWPDPDNLRSSLFKTPAVIATAAVSSWFTVEQKYFTEFSWWLIFILMTCAWGHFCRHSSYWCCDGYGWYADRERWSAMYVSYGRPLRSCVLPRQRCTRKWMVCLKCC